MHGILCANPTDPFQCHGLRRQHQEYRFNQVECSYDCLQLHMAKGCGMSQMGMPHHRVGHVFVQNELILLNISVFQVALTLQAF